MTMTEEQDYINRAILDVAAKMVLAARTAPKTRGRNTIETTIIKGNLKSKLARQMDLIGADTGAHYFKRDAENVRQSSLLVLIGTRIQAMQLPHCGLCGFGDCESKEKYTDVPCAYNITDLGIALGSAVSVAMDHRVDNRIMYTAGMAARDLDMLGQDIKMVLAIPLSASSKNIYFDRKQ